MSDEDWESDFSLKVWGAVRFIRAVVPAMRKAGGGRIINVTNLGGRTPGAASMPTSISRAAGIAITKGLSRDLAKDILVTTVCIGLIKSGQHERRYARLKATNPDLTMEELYAQGVKARGVPLGRFGEAHEAGDVIAFLASERASYLTGIAINIDGEFAGRLATVALKRADPCSLSLGEGAKQRLRTPLALSRLWWLSFQIRRIPERIRPQKPTAAWPHPGHCCPRRAGCRRG